MTGALRGTKAMTNEEVVCYLVSQSMKNTSNSLVERIARFDLLIRSLEPAVTNDQLIALFEPLKEYVLTEGKAIQLSSLPSSDVSPTLLTVQLPLLLKLIPKQELEKTKKVTIDFTNELESQFVLKLDAEMLLMTVKSSFVCEEGLLAAQVAEIEQMEQNGKMNSFFEVFCEAVRKEGGVPFESVEKEPDMSLAGIL